MQRQRLVSRLVGWGVVLATGLAWASGAAVLADSSAEEQAKAILDATGVQGGLVVHLGCGDGKLTAALHAGDAFLVHGLDSSRKNVEAARRYIQSLGLYGPVWVEQWSGEQIPYVDNSVNLLVVERPGKVTREEMLRVLVPNGVAYLKTADGWQKLVKPWPEGMDQWTHYLHDSTNNAVSHDQFIAPLGRYQWIGTPRYSRHHDHMSAFDAAVTANGRLFYIIDEAPRESILIPPEWRLVARDAFNGTVLWKRPIEKWHIHLWPLKSGPQLLTRRLVAVGDRVYVTLSIDGPVVELDAATGKTLRTFDGTAAAEEILWSDGVLFLSVAAEGQPLRSDPNRVYADMQAIRADTEDPRWTTVPRTLMAIDLKTGRTLWKKVSGLTAMSLTVDSRAVYFHDGERIQCLDRRTGKQRWQSQPLPKQLPMRSSGGATLVVYDDVVLYSGHVNEQNPRSRSTTMYALSADDGRLLWKAEHPPCGHRGTPDDILVADGLVWVGAVAIGSDSGTVTGRDLHTGEVKVQFDPDVQTHWFHHRCYRAKATDKYLLFSRTGIEFVDHAQKHWICHHWVRGACLYGILPANGLVYAPQHPCACYLEAKLFGLSALAPKDERSEPRREIPDSERLQKGPAYGNQLSGSSGPDDWPTYRHDAARSGSTSTPVSQPDSLRQTWLTELGGKLSSPVVADGKVFVASVEQHTVYALDAETGQVVWSFTAGGRVDSPPTVWQGRVLFGSADGYVYCVRASDGELVWRYRAAPEDRRMGAMERVESVWPVHGSVLVLNDVLYCVAGRSMFLDGGLRFLRLDPKTGRKISETILDDKEPQSGQNLQVKIKGLNMPVALPDVLSSDGRYVYMRSLPLTLDGKRKFVEYVNVDQQRGDDVHLFSPTGFLDHSMWHRTYWLYGRAWASGAGGYYQAGRRVPAGRLLVFDDTTVYGYGRHWQYYRWTTPLEFELFAADKQAEIVPAGSESRPVRRRGKVVGRRKRTVTRFVTRWSMDTPVQVNSLVLAGDLLFAAGPPDVVDEEEAARRLADPEIQKKLAEQQEALEGKRGGLLVAVRKKDGSRVASYRLPWMPNFDGLIAAGGKLYLTTCDGRVVCLGDQGDRPLEAADVPVTPHEPAQTARRRR